MLIVKKVKTMGNLNNFGVQELNTREIEEIQGGLMIGLCICLFALGVAIGTLSVSGKA